MVALSETKLSGVRGGGAVTGASVKVRLSSIKDVWVVRDG